MSDELNLCQGTKCHEYRTKDRIRGTKGSKHYQTRRRSSFYYGGGNFCSLNCQNDWFDKFGNRAIDHFGRLKEPKKNECDNAWYKDYKYNYNNGTDSNYNHFYINDLLGKKIPITEQQYNDEDYTLNNAGQ